MFTTYEKIILGFNCVFLCIGLLNLTIGLYNMLANRRVERHTQDLKDSVGSKGYPE